MAPLGCSPNCGKNLRPARACGPVVRINLHSLRKLPCACSVPAHAKTRCAAKDQPEGVAREEAPERGPSEWQAGKDLFLRQLAPAAMDALSSSPRVRNAVAKRVEGTYRV